MENYQMYRPSWRDMENYQMCRPAWREMENYQMYRPAWREMENYQMYRPAWREMNYQMYRPAWREMENYQMCRPAWREMDNYQRYSPFMREMGDYQRYFPFMSEMGSYQGYRPAWWEMENYQMYRPARREMDNYEVYRALVKGIEEFKFMGKAQPGPLKLTSARALPIAMSPKGSVLLAAAQYGRGRIVVMSHEAYLSQGSMPASGRFVQNAIDWLKPHNNATVGVCGLENLESTVAHDGTKVKSMPTFDDSVGVFCCDAYNNGLQVDRLLNFVCGGGGLLIAGQAWDWSQANPGADVQSLFPGNRLTGPAGIFFTNEYGENATIRVPLELPSKPGLESA